MEKSDFKKIVKLSISSVVVSTFLVNTFVLFYIEIYNRSAIAKFNSESAFLIKSEKEICLALRQPWGGMAFYKDIFSFGSTLIGVSAVLVFAIFIFSLLSKKWKCFSWCEIVILAFLVFLSWFLLFGAWTGVDVWFYNCARFYY